ncbi:SGNH/GDSL hydrolase family protein [Micromonospora sp. NPDC049559]|uniref:SGNH/GDSL hydrolase family protein n=1 Tax=Micromonospora sp. NPDC049559 TaxID=3155923 RepID=UPI0034374E8D
MPRSPLARALVALAATVTAATAGVLAPAVAQAAPRAAVNYVALGDSYSSGVGAGSYDLSTCLRSSRSYASLWAAGHAVTSFRFPACGGAVTADVRDGQVSSLDAGTTLATITIGGNDAGFAYVVSSCRFGSDADCTAAVDQARTFATTELPGRLDQTYAAIRDRAPNARLVVLGYPRLFELGSCGLFGMSTYKRTILNQAADVLHSVISARAGAAGATYVDVRGRFAGHGVCASTPWIKDITGLIEAYHPNADGYRYGYLAALQSAIG